ncbi:MAG: DUF523 domain-containing protein [Acidaminococcaceae bacterium]|nr:DUF523 domain-containing protein [Acidaminococcaceae bacterium]MDD4721289.1 DUF523 domain-containing protein [Acidaminococcaceae bacterium]
MNILVSACLLNLNCRYNGQGQTMPTTSQLLKKYNLVPICPEIYGGLSTPRESSEIKNGRVISQSGKDLTEYFERGAQEILKLAKLYNCKYAILKERSPSCGYKTIYDGTFSGTVINGNGILADLLAKNGLNILNENETDWLL